MEYRRRHTGSPYCCLFAASSHRSANRAGYPCCALYRSLRLVCGSKPQPNPTADYPRLDNRTAWVSILISRGFEDDAFHDGPRQVRRDHVATVIAGGRDMNKRLLVNGVGITSLIPITKVMAHLPLALNGHAQSGLVICFGMGTTARATLSWGIETTAVDLVPSVPELFGFFFADASSVQSDPRMHMVIDDGRRFLLRTNRRFDVITIDPPPPVEAAGSSLLYSREFYDVIKTHLNPNGILAQWFPKGEKQILSAVARSISGSFRHVTIYQSVEDWGYHLLASEAPIPEITP